VPPNLVPDLDLTEIRSPLNMATNLKNATTKPSGSKGVPPIVKKPQVARPNKVTRTEYVYKCIHRRMYYQTRDSHCDLVLMLSTELQKAFCKYIMSAWMVLYEMR
jgi:hypothetical protein